MQPTSLSLAASPHLSRRGPRAAGLALICLAAGCGLATTGLEIERAGDAGNPPTVPGAGSAAGPGPAADAGPPPAPGEPSPAVQADAVGPAPETTGVPGLDAAAAGAAVAPPPLAPVADAAPAPPPADARVADVVSTPDPGQPPRALLMVGHVPLDPADRRLEQRLQGLGFLVQSQAVRDGGAARDAAAAAAGRQLLVMSSSMPDGASASGLGSELSLPVLCLEATFVADLGLGGPGVQAAVDQTIDIVTPGHPLAAGRSGRTSLTTRPTPLTSAEPVRAATIIATAPGDPLAATIFAVDRAAATNLGPAPERRVAWLARDATVNTLGGDGWALFDAAVRWVARR